MSKTALRRKPEKPSKLGKLPEWDLTDLYPGLDSPQIKSDLEQGDLDCQAFEQRFKGRLATLAAGEGAGERWLKRSSNTRRSMTGLAG